MHGFGSTAIRSGTDVAQDGTELDCFPFLCLAGDHHISTLCSGRVPLPDAIRVAWDHLRGNEMLRTLAWVPT
ncbi:hypothetical protein PISMIDRAFT_323118 [Pisolithus microcarpus 441]|uniref:Uncharacterized protein n=1 Tax=Pisolithus microcarpus 441 TaxID=765257 RepID=A0A0C9YZ36_9AGAM|nr:hypothetical protein PISMIDRAFT_323118 [Pisolithus microcarpus 441]